MSYFVYIINYIITLTLLQRNSLVVPLGVVKPGEIYFNQNKSATVVFNIRQVQMKRVALVAGDHDLGVSFC